MLNRLHVAWRSTSSPAVNIQEAKKPARIEFPVRTLVLEYLACVTARMAGCIPLFFAFLTQLFSRNMERRTYACRIDNERLATSVISGFSG